MQAIGFVGLGLIGGSLARAVRRVLPEVSVRAYDPDRETVAAALKDGVIDMSCEEGDEPLLACDYLFLCAPVEFNLLWMERLAHKLPPSCVLTDVGSVKGPIHERSRVLGISAQFIGGHPMTGSERSGYGASGAGLLENAYYIITPGDELPFDRLGEFTELIRSLGAIPLVLSPEDHDYVTAGVSHLPHVIAAALVNLLSSIDDEGQTMKAVAAGGFKDITRIASSSPEMWRQICLENRENISRVLDEYIRLLIDTRCLLDEGDEQRILQFFSASRDYRDSIDDTRPGLLAKAFVIYLDIADEAGSIAAIAAILAAGNISIKNIGIVHNREFEEGVLRIEFYQEEAMAQGAALLQKRNYTIYQR